MSFEDEVLELLREIPAPPEESAPDGASEEELYEFEKSHGFTIPAGLRSWLLATNGPCVGPGGIVGLGTMRDSQDAVNILENHPEWINKGWFPIAGDGCGSYYVVSTRNEFGSGEPILFIDVNEDETQPAFIAASNTWRFLHFLFRKEIGKSNWPYAEAEVVAEDPKITSFSGVPLPWEA